MSATVTLVEVLDRAAQGVTRPFLCRGDDGALYYVKGRWAGLHSLCCEWTAGNLARLLGLPVPNFAIAEVPAALVEGSERTDIGELGSGLVFASSLVGSAREITWVDAQSIAEEVRARVLLFDWWVHNEDRCLTSLGGNPNLLMAPKGAGGAALWTIDFNLAFDAEFSADRFWENHIFASLVPSWPEGFRERMEPMLRVAAEGLGDLFHALPQEWLHVDADETLPAQLSERSVAETLSRPFTESDIFWSRA